MDQTTLKLECLKLATEKAVNPESAKIVATAQSYWDWLTSSDWHQKQHPSTEDRC